jgi:predicted nucleic acid-binding protein
VIVVSDTNILSSLAAGDSLPALLRLFARSTLCIPPSVRDELQMGLDKGRTYLEPIFRVITAQQQRSLSEDEQREAVELVEEENFVTLRKARALFLLKHRGILPGNLRLDP